MSIRRMRTTVVAILVVAGPLAMAQEPAPSPSPTPATRTSFFQPAVTAALPTAGSFTAG